jgi:hypothetical protein
MFSNYAVVTFGVAAIAVLSGGGGGEIADGESTRVDPKPPFASSDAGAPSTGSDGAAPGVPRPKPPSTPHAVSCRAGLEAWRNPEGGLECRSFLACQSVVVRKYGTAGGLGPITSFDGKPERRTIALDGTHVTLPWLSSLAGVVQFRSPRSHGTFRSCSFGALGGDVVNLSGTAAGQYPGPEGDLNGVNSPYPGVDNCKPWQVGSYTSRRKDGKTQTQYSSNLPGLYVADSISSDGSFARYTEYVEADGPAFFCTSDLEPAPAEAVASCEPDLCFVDGQCAAPAASCKCE